MANVGDTTVAEGKGTSDQATIRIVLADDHAVIRSALRMLLDSEPDLEVVAEAGQVDDAERYVRGHRPDILILDLNMPGRPSLEALPDLAEASPETAIVILTMQSELAFAREALQAGVRGYILKEAADSELVRAVRTAASGETYVQPELGGRLAAHARDSRSLSARELEIIKLIALGNTSAEIAERLSLSNRTIESHRARIMDKLQLSRRSELVRYALDNGLLED